MESSMMWSMKALGRMTILSLVITAYWIAVPFVAQLAGFAR
jgi:hypothetical protein